MIELAVAVVLLAGGAGAIAAGAGGDEGLKLSGSQAVRLLRASYCHRDDEERRMSREKLLRTRARDRKKIFQAFGRAGPFLSEGSQADQPRSETFKLPVTGGESSHGRFVVHLPAKYRGKKPWPMVMRFHGSGGSGQEYARLWEGTPPADQFIAVMPTIPTSERIGWNLAVTRGFVMEIYRYMLTHYNVDTDRVCFAGFSAGGGAAFYFAQTWPELCAGFLASGRLWWNNDSTRDECMSVLRHVPGFFQVGLDDAAERVDGFRTAEAFGRKGRFPWQFHFVEGVGHRIVPKVQLEGYEFLLKQERKRHPREFDAFFFGIRGRPEYDPFFTGAYWIRALDFNRTGTTCLVRVKGNRIDIEAPGLRAVRLLLNDEIVNLDKPVTVTLNGEEVHSAMVERSVGFLLGWFEENRDPRRLFWNSVEVSMAREDGR